MAICKHIKAKHCNASGPYTHDFPCSTVDGLLPTQSSVGDKFYIPNVNYNVWGCDGYVITGVYPCGTVSNSSPLNCTGQNGPPMDLTTCGVDANGDPLWVPGVTSPSLFGIDCQDCYDKACPPITGCTDPTANNYNSLATFDDGSCTYGPIVTGTSTSHCYCCYQNNVVGVIQQLPIGQSCAALNGSNGYSDCNHNHLLVQCEPIFKPKNCYCCDGANGIGVNQAANPLPFGQDCSYYNDPTGSGWYDCSHDYATLQCDSYANDCTCCDNGTALAMGPAPNFQNCSWFNTLGYSLCDLTTNFNQVACEPDPNEHCACCKNGQMTMVGLPLPLGQDCSWWSGMYGWNSCTGATYFNIDDCEDCHCNELIGTGHTSAFSYNLSGDCLEGCCDPDLKKCDVLVVGDDEGVQVYSTTGDNTTHLFDVPLHDTKDIAANQDFIWVYRYTSTGTQIDEYQLVMAPFTNIYRRTITINSMIGNGLTFYGVNAGFMYLTSVNTETLELAIPFGPPGTNITITPTTINSLPTGYKCTGDMLTRGMGNSASGFNISLDVILYDNGTTYKVGKFQRLTGLVLEEHTIDPAIMTGTTEFHSLYTDIPNNRLAGITTDGRIYELIQSPNLEFGSTPIGHIDFYNTGGTSGHTIYGATNVDYGDGTCARKILVYPKTYDCTINGCIDPNDGTGQYTGPTASVDCNTACIITWNCNPGTGYPNCTFVTETLLYKISIMGITFPYIQSGPAAINHISTAGNGLQYNDFNTIGFYWLLQPVLPGQCSKWSSSGGVGKWKISEISHPQITTTVPIQSWAAFISTLISNGVTTVNMSMNYAQVQNMLYAHFGAQYQIDVTYEPCICTPIPCECTPLMGNGGTFSTSASCMTSCCPLPPCVICCQSNINLGSSFYYTWMHTSLTSPCYCPTNSTQLPCITCNKCCTNGTLQIMLNLNDQNCDCANYGLWSCYLPPCKKCCYNKHTGLITQAQLPDCNCKQGEWTVPCKSLPDDVRCLPLSPVTSVTATTVTPIRVIDDVLLSDPGNTVTTGTSVNVTSATKIYLIYDTSSLTAGYINQIQNSVSDWLISNGLTTNNVETIEEGDERWIRFPSTLYGGGFATPNIGTPAYSDDVLLIIFQDESHPHYHIGSMPSVAYQSASATWIPDTCPLTGTWMGDYSLFKTTHSQITGNFKAVMYTTQPYGQMYNNNRVQFSMQTLQAISSGNNSPLDGMWQTGTAPRGTGNPNFPGTGTVGGTPELCQITNLQNLEVTNPYWGLAPYGGLDQFGWNINVRFSPVNTIELTSYLNNLL